MDQSSQLREKGNNPADESINFNDFLTSLWHSRRVILGVTILSAAIGAATVYAFPKYRSEGFFQFGGPIPVTVQKNIKDPEPNPGISLANYKRYAAAFNTSGRFVEFSEKNKTLDAKDFEKMRRAFSAREGISQMIEPVFPFTKLDAKELAGEVKDGNNNVIGLRISAVNDTPDGAQRMFALMGRYAIDTIIYLIYSDNLRFKQTEITTKITKLDNDIIKEKEGLEKFKRKGSDLKQIVNRYPEPASQASRQIVTINDDNARYLSPVTQLMTSEVEISEATEAILQAKTEQSKNTLLLEYYKKAKDLINSTSSGEEVLRGLEPLKIEVFKNKNMDDEVIKQVYNSITIDNQNALNIYLEKSRFIAGPSLPENRADRLSQVVGKAALFGLLLSLIFVIGRNWWRENNLSLLK